MYWLVGKGCQLAPLISLPWSLVSLIFGLWRVSLAEYLLVLSVYFPLLQIVRCIMATIRTTSVPPWTRSRALGKASLVNSSLILLWKLNMSWHRIWIVMIDVGFKLYLLPLLLYLNLVSNNFESYSNVWNCNCELYVMYDMYVESCMILVVCWWLIETLCGTRRTTGFIWAQVWQRDSLRAAIVLVLL